MVTINFKSFNFFLLNSDQTKAAVCMPLFLLNVYELLTGKIFRVKILKAVSKRYSKRAN